jgi:hypothetical protein
VSAFHQTAADAARKHCSEARIMTAMVPAESRFGAVPIEVLDRNPAPNAVDGALERGVPAFGGVGMRVGGGMRIGANVPETCAQ